MNTVLRLLKKELIEWENHFDYEKQYFKGEELSKRATISFVECNEHINELKCAIKYLSKQPPSDTQLVKAMGKIAKEKKHLHNDQYAAFKFGFRNGAKWVCKYFINES